MDKRPFHQVNCQLFLSETLLIPLHQTYSSIRRLFFSVFTLNRKSDNRCVLIGLNNWRRWSRNQWNRLMNYAWGRGNLYESTHGWWSEERSEKPWVSDDDFYLDTKNKICSKKFTMHELRVIIKGYTTSTWRNKMTKWRLFGTGPII